MESIKFDESQLENLDKIATKLFDDENDPRCISYKRTLVRPKINWFTFLLWILCPILFVFVMQHELQKFGISFEVNGVILLGLLIYSVLMAKKFVIFLIKVYQRYAPAKIRMKCRFEPSCSEYMILAIGKYGLMKGVIRGINRLKRCNVNNGGFDEP